MNKFYLIVLFLSFFTMPVSGQVIQKTSNIWYFGDRAGLDFNTESPSVLTNGQIDSQEGVASLSDDNGDLLFYTDGITVWDKSHTPMPGGTESLNGHASSSQSALIVPDLSDSDLYYIFTTDELAGVNGLSYSTIDLSLAGNGTPDNPMGNVVLSELNIQLETPVCEKIIGVLKPDYSGYWIIAHGWINNTFLAYEVTCEGINPEPVRSNVGNVHAGGIDNLNAVGYMKASFDGRRLAATNRNTGTIDLFSFNNETGVVSNQIEVFPPDASFLYGLEFSLSGQYLYIGGRDEISRYEIGSGILSTVPVDVPSAFNTTNVVRALQLGPDGNIYIAARFREYISIIFDPDESDALVVTDGIDLDPDDVGRNGRFGLPNNFYFDLFPPDTVFLSICSGSSIEYEGTVYDAEAIHEIHLQKENGCDSTFYLVVDVFDSFEEELNVIVCDGSGSYEYNGLEILAGTQEVFVFSSNNGCDSILVINVEMGIEGKDNLIEIPNAFTPNDDGISDVFKVFFREDIQVEKFEIYIYNRWGTKVFESENFNFEWNGLFKNEELNSDTYVYWLRAYVIACDVEIDVFEKGDIVIIR